MRQDMYRVLTERPRGGHRRKTFRGNRPKISEWAGEDSFAGDYRPRRLETKYFSDLISPLRRWLRAQVSRPWDKVWSELVGGVDSRTLMGGHLLEHASLEVEQHCHVDASTRSLRDLRGNAVTGLYVDPRTGLLRWKPPLSKAQRRRPPLLVSAITPDTFPLGENRFRIKRNGIWFDADVTPLRPSTNKKIPFDFEWIGQRFIIVRKRSLNARNLREAGLKNDDA